MVIPIEIFEDFKERTWIKNERITKHKKRVQAINTVTKNIFSCDFNDIPDDEGNSPLMKIAQEAQLRKDRGCQMGKRE